MCGARRPGGLGSGVSMLRNGTGIDESTKRRQEPPGHLDRLRGASNNSRRKVRKVGLCASAPPVQIHWQRGKVRKGYRRFQESPQRRTVPAVWCKETSELVVGCAAGSSTALANIAQQWEKKCRRRGPFRVLLWRVPTSTSRFPRRGKGLPPNHIPAPERLSACSFST